MTLASFSPVDPRFTVSRPIPPAALASRWCLLVAFILFLGAACTQSAPVAEIRAPSPAQRAPDVVLRAMASVLISEAPERKTPPVKSIEISPNPVVVDPGDGIQLSAQAFGPEGQPLSDVEFVWTTADLKAGTITRDGEFQAANRPGAFENSISVMGIQNTPDGIKYAQESISITIVGEASAPTLSSVEIVPANPTILSRQIYRLRAVGLDQDGLVIPGVSFVWKLNVPRLGHVNDIGYLTVEGEVGKYREAVTLTAIWEGVKVSATTDVSVVSTPKADDFLSVQALPQRFFLEPGDRLQLKAVALNGLGELVAGTQLRWSVQNAKAGTIDGKGNFIAGTTSGVYTEAVRVEAVVPGERGFVRAVDFASVVIKRKRASSRLSAVSVYPPKVVLAPNGRVNFVAMPISESGEPAENVTISWGTLKEEVGKFADFGAFTGGNSRGNHPDALLVTVTQRFGDDEITKTKAVDVAITGTLTSAEIHPAMAIVTPQRTAHFSVTGWDENKIELAGLVVVWSLSDDNVGTIDAFGNFTAGPTAGVYKDVIRAKIIQAPTGGR